MAEAFGVAAGVVGLASLSIQLADSVQKLRNYYRIYDEAPENVRSLIETLETLKRILDQVCPSTGAYTASPVHVQLLEDCRNWCQGIKDNIHGTLITIEAEILRRPRLGKAKFILHKTSIDQLLQKLHDAKLDLLLCLQIFGGHHHTYNFSAVHTELRTLLQTNSTILQQLPVAAQQIRHLNGSVQALVDRNHRVERTVDMLQSSTHIIRADLKAMQEKITSFSIHAERAIALQSSALQHLKDNTIKTELAAFQQLLSQSEDDKRLVLDELCKMNARIEKLGLDDNCHLSKHGHSHDTETIEVSFLWFKYRYERSGPRALVPTSHRRKTSNLSRETVWLRVQLPSWFIGNQWVLQFAKATSGWQNPLRMYKVLQNDEEVFELCVQGNVEAVKKLIIGGKVSIYDQNEAGLTLLHVAAFAHQTALCEFLIGEGAKPHALSHVKESPLHVMLYAIPTTLSVENTLRLFRLLSMYYEDDDLIASHSENARLFLEAPLWSAEDHFLFILKLHQPPRLVDLSVVDDSSEAMRVKALEADLAQIKGVDSISELHVHGPDDISSVFHFAAYRFLEVAFYSTPPSTGPFQHWKDLCIQQLQTGSNPCYTHKGGGTSAWTTALVVALRRRVNTLHERQIGWERSTMIVKNAIQHWNSMLLDSGANGYACACDEERLFRVVRSQQKAVFPHESASADEFWHWFTSRIGLHVDYRSGTESYALNVSFTEPAYTWTDFSQENKDARQALALRLQEAKSSGSRSRLMPGSFPDDGPQTLQLLAERTADIERYPPHLDRSPSEARKSDLPEPQIKDLSMGFFDISGVTEEYSARSWAAIHEILEDSPEAEAYRKLRFGVEGLVHPSRHDFGHGIACDCWECTARRDDVHQHVTQLRNRYVERFRSRGYGGFGYQGYGGDGGGGGSSRPRRPGPQKPPQARDDPSI